MLCFKVHYLFCYLHPGALCSLINAITQTSSQVHYANHLLLKAKLSGGIFAAGYHQNYMF